jgi:hypothetical protein
VGLGTAYYTSEQCSYRARTIARAEARAAAASSQVGQKRSSCGFEEPSEKRSHGGADDDVEMAGPEAILDFDQFDELEL